VYLPVRNYAFGLTRQLWTLVLARMNPPVMPMSRGRVGLVLSLAFVLVAGHSYDIIRQREHWPFSFYPMYGRVQRKPVLKMPALYGLMQQGKRAKGQRITRSYVPQLSEARIRNFLLAAWGRDGSAPGSKQKVAAILRDYIKMYEGRRRNGLIKDENGNPMPMMVEAQFVMITYSVKPDAPNRRARSVDAILGVRKDGTVIDYTTPASSPAVVDPPDPDGDVE
jgi:hypothetical protein